MSTITKERVAGIASGEKCYTHDDVVELARIALASLEAKPVSVNDDMAYAFHHAISDSSLGSDEVEEIKTGLRAAFANVTAPPAPASVPEWTNEQCLEFLSIAFRHAEIKGDLELDDIRLGVKMVNGSRAAMLQGAEPVTTAYKLPFEQWLSQQTGTIDVECGCVMTEVFFHWLRVAYEAGNSPVTPGGWVACSERMPVDFETVLVCQDGGVIFCAEYEDGDFYPDEFPNVPKQGCEITHWMPLPAAPQQEVK